MYIVPDRYMQIVNVYVGKAVPVYVQARSMAYTALDHAAVEK